MVMLPGPSGLPFSVLAWWGFDGDDEPPKSVRLDEPGVEFEIFAKLGVFAISPGPTGPLCPGRPILCRLLLSGPQFCGLPLSGVAEFLANGSKWFLFIIWTNCEL